MGNKSKWIGLIILLVVIAAGGIYLLLGGGPQPEPAVLRGYVGGEKIGLLEDAEVQDILYRLVLQQADLLSPPHSPAERLAPAGGRRPAADRPPPPR